MAEIRPLKKNDLDEFVAFRTRPDGEISFLNTDMAKSVAIKVIDEYSHSDDKQAYILVSGSVIVGQLFLQLKNNKKICHIALISVDAQHRGTGAADKLMDKAISIANDNKATVIELMVNKDNERAIAFYKKKGFKFVKDQSKTARLYRLTLLSSVANESMAPINKPEYMEW